MSALVEITLPQCFVNAAVELMSAPLNGGLSVGLPAQDRAASRQPITINLGSWSLPLPGFRVWCITGDGAAKACFTSDSRVSRRACILVTRARRASVLVTKASRRAIRARIDRGSSANDSCRARGPERALLLPQKLLAELCKGHGMRGV